MDWSECDACGETKANMQLLKYPDLFLGVFAKLEVMKQLLIDTYQGN